METLQNALNQIAQIHEQMARTRTFRGYRALTTFFTAIVAVLAALFETWFVPNPERHPSYFVLYWISVAAGCLLVVGLEMAWRFRRSDSMLQRQLTAQAIEQFLPSLLVGGAVTLLIDQFAREAVWLLPGFWAIFFGLGILASRQLLPPQIRYVGAFYLLCGLILIGAVGASSTLSPWSVAMPFAIGQSVAAFILHWSLERHHESQ